jgi:hypothetical protein
MLLRYQPMESALMRVVGRVAPRPLPAPDLPDGSVAEGFVVNGFEAAREELSEAECAGVPTPLPSEMNCARNVALVRWFLGLNFKEILDW